MTKKIKLAPLWKRLLYSWVFGAIIVLVLSVLIFLFFKLVTHPSLYDMLLGFSCVVIPLLLGWSLCGKREAESE